MARPTALPTVSMTRIIEAPVDEVFRAWTDPAMLYQWMAPRPCKVQEAIVDARPGGQYSITVVDSSNGDVHRTTGHYREVVPGRRLVKTWKYDGPNGPDVTPSLVTVDFRELRPGVTELTVTHAQLRSDEAARLVSGGWPLCLEQLDAVLHQPAERREPAAGPSARR